MISTKEFTKTLGDVFKTKGENEEQVSKVFEVFYDFTPGTNNPILLF